MKFLDFILSFWKPKPNPEDEVFRLLRRTDFNTLRDMEVDNFHTRKYFRTHEGRLAFYKQQGWTMKEYQKALKGQT